MTRDEAISIGADKTFTLDLNGYSIMVDEPIRVSGNLTIQDRTTAGEPVVSSDYGSVSYDAGSIEYTGSNTAIIVQEGGSVTLKSGIVDASAAGTGIYVNGNRNPEGSENIQPVNSSATIEGGYVHSMEYGLGAAGRGGKLTVSGGVIAAEGNTAIGRAPRS